MFEPQVDIRPPSRRARTLTGPRGATRRPGARGAGARWPARWRPAGGERVCDGGQGWGHCGEVLTLKGTVQKARAVKPVHLSMLPESTGTVSARVIASPTAFSSARVCEELARGGVHEPVAREHSSNLTD